MKALLITALLIHFPMLQLHSAEFSAGVKGSPSSLSNEVTYLETLERYIHGSGQSYICQELYANGKLDRIAIIDIKNKIITYKRGDLIFSLNSIGEALLRTSDSKGWTKVSPRRIDAIKVQVTEILASATVYGELSKDMSELELLIQRTAQKGNVEALPAMVMQQEKIKRIIAGESGEWKWSTYDIGKFGLIRQKLTSINLKNQSLHFEIKNRSIDESEVNTILPIALNAASTDFESEGKVLPEIFINGGYAWDKIIEEIPDGIDSNVPTRGFKLQKRSGAYYVYSVIKGSSAAKAGLHSGLRLEKIGDTPINGLSAEQIKTLLASPLNSTFTFADKESSRNIDIPLSPLDVLSR